MTEHTNPHPVVRHLRDGHADRVADLLARNLAADVVWITTKGYPKGRFG